MASGNHEEQVTIEFLGICAHFQHSVAGVPHRVVLPQTNRVGYGSLQTGPIGAMPYELPPHVAFVCDGEQPGIDAPPGLVQGIVKTGVRLQIINAIHSDPLSYDPSFDTVPCLRDYMPEFRYGIDVVAGGRAQCYFDIFRGTVTAKETVTKGPIHTFVTMKTDGPPRLQITQLDVSSDPDLDKVYEVVIGPNLYVGNSSCFCTDAKVDFLWHYLTNVSSIPLRLKMDPPGFLEPVPCPEMWHDASKLAREGPPADFIHKVRRLGETEDSASCSNSRYP